MSDASTFRVGIVVPALDAGASIDTVITGARAYGHPVVVVDDGSTDDTAARAEAAGATVIRHPSNRGKGAALRTGMQRLAHEGFTHALTMDADGQHLAREIPQMVAAATATPRALIMGARIIGDQPVAAANRFGNWFANGAVRIAARMDAGDTQCGFRIYPLAEILPLPVSGSHFNYETTVIVHAVRAGVTLCSVPVAVFYPPVALRRSHYRNVLDTLRIIRVMVPLLMRR
jgi:glycosyltransferase involved in cell wall biosynthesis